jgi:hypothetical protein
MEAAQPLYGEIVDGAVAIASIIHFERQTANNLLRGIAQCKELFGAVQETSHLVKK